MTLAATNLAILGLQWGDEGKGKLVDLLAARFQNVTRFQGGNNAGHTVVVDGQSIALHQVPSGALHPGCFLVVGSGVVLNLEVFLKELENLRGKGFDLAGRLLISDRAHVILPHHIALDQWREGGSAQDRHHRPRHRPRLRDEGGAQGRPDGRPAPPRSPGGADPAWLRRGAPPAGPDRRPGLPGVHRRRAHPALPAAPAAHRQRPGVPLEGLARRRIHPVRRRPGDPAGHRPRHLPLRHQFQLQHRRPVHRHRAAPARRSATSWASPRPTPPGWAPAPCHPNSWTPPAKGCARWAANSAPPPGARAAAAGSTPSSPATPAAPTAPTAWAS